MMFLKAGDESAELIDRELVVIGHSGVALGLADRLLEQVGINAEDDLAEHLKHTAIAVEGEVLIGQLGEAGISRIGEAKVEDSVHHAGHRELGAGADGKKEGTGGIAEVSPQVVLDLGQGRAHVIPQADWNLPT